MPNCLAYRQKGAITAFLFTEFPQRTSATNTVVSLGDRHPRRVFLPPPESSVGQCRIDTGVWDRKNLSFSSPLGATTDWANFFSPAIRFSQLLSLSEERGKLI